MRCKPVLIVEDDHDLRENVAEALEYEGHRALQASNGKEALEILRAVPPPEWPGCILLDLMMPVMDGRSFMHALQNEYPDDLGRLAIFIWTAQSDLAKAMANLPFQVDVLRKPVDLDSLLEAVTRHCGVPRDG